MADSNETIPVITSQEKKNVELGKTLSTSISKGKQWKIWKNEAKNIKYFRQKAMLSKKDNNVENSNKTCKTLTTAETPSLSIPKTADCKKNIPVLINRIKTTVDSGKSIPTKTVKGKQWKVLKTEPKEMKYLQQKAMFPVKNNKAENRKKTFRKIKNKKSMNAWNLMDEMKTMQTIEGPDNLRQNEIQHNVNFEMDKPNLKVVEGPASSIQLNLDKSKGLMVEKVKQSVKLMEKKEAVKTEGSTQLPSPGGSQPTSAAQQTPAVSGRMTASSFMNLSQHQAPVNQQQPRKQIQPNYSHLPSYSFPKGIPKSFLKPEHQIQLQEKNIANQPIYSSPQTGIPRSFLTESHKKIIASQPIYPSPQTGIPRSFLKPEYQNQLTESQKKNIANQPIYPSPQTGIPRSFLKAEYQNQLTESQQQNMTNQQIYSSPQTALNPTYNKGPVWEPADKPQTQTWNPVQSGSALSQGDQTFYQSDQMFVQSEQSNIYDQQMFVQIDDSMEQPKQQYSPSDAYDDNALETGDGQESPDSQQSGSKRLSAFKRLGPVTQPKKPKLTINLLINKEQAVREVVDQSYDEESEKYTPAHLKPDIQTSIDDTVMKYLVFWPWKKPPYVRRTIYSKNYAKMKSLAMTDTELLDDLYEKKDNTFYQVSVTGYPSSWSKEDVLDAILESVKGKSMIPCFIEITKHECKFLVIRNGPALKAIHKYGFVYRKNEVELNISIMLITLNLNQIDYIPRLVLRKRLSFLMDSSNTELNLKEFTTTSDVSHFIYFPLNRVENQNELVRLQSTVPWESLTKLDLSHNRISNLSGFDLCRYTPRLKHLDLSYNCLAGVTALLTCRALPLRSLALEGNPLCPDYVEQERYIKALRMIFPELREIDGVKLALAGDMPKTKRNHCIPDAMEVSDKVLEVLFPLLDAPPDQRQLCEELYDVNAILTITFMYKLRYGPIYKDYHPLFLHARVLDEGEMDSVVGAANIAKLVYRWPMLQHDPHTFTVDVIYHTDTTTILRVSGIVRVTTESLAEDEHLLSFTRTLVLHSIDTVEYKITNEMIYWDLPGKERAKDAFRTTTVKSKNLSLKLDAPPDEDLQEKLLQIFMSVTEMARKPSIRCLEIKEWHLKNALEYFVKLLKLDNLEPLYD